MGVHRTCGEPDETKKNTHPEYITALFLEQGACRAARTAACGNAPRVQWASMEPAASTERTAPSSAGTRPEPFSFTPMAVNSISPAHLHVRPMWALSTCRWAGETKKGTHPRNVLPLFPASRHGNCLGTEAIACDKETGEARRCGACKEGFYGTVADPSDAATSDCSLRCEQGECEGVATCAKNGTGSKCGACKGGYHGAICDEACAQGECDGAVVCDQGSGLQRRCTGCAAGFHGTDCTAACERPEHCADDSAVSCDQRTGAPTKCAAVEPARPACAPGYDGATCGDEINECAGVSCSNRGTCTDLIAGFRCACDTPEEWAGALCDVEFDGLVSFVVPPTPGSHAPSKSYAQFDETVSWGSFSIEFRTTATDGVLAFAPNASGTGTGGGGGGTFAIELVAGVVVLNTGGLAHPINSLDSGIGKANDGAWHHLAVTQGQGTVQATLDTTHVVALAGVRSLGSSAQFYLGGVWPWLDEHHALFKSGRNFAGCLRRVRTAMAGTLTKKSGKIFRLGIFLDFVWLTTRTPHGAYVRRARRNRIGRHGGEIERLALQVRRSTCGMHQKARGCPTSATTRTTAPVRAMNSRVQFHPKWGSIRFLPLVRTRVRPMGVHRTCRRAGEIKKHANPEWFTALACEQVTLIIPLSYPPGFFTALACEQVTLAVSTAPARTSGTTSSARAPSGTPLAFACSIPPPCGSIRFRLAPRAYDDTPPMWALSTCGA